LVRACRFKLPVKQVRRNCVDWRIELPWCATTLVTSLDASCFHQSGHTVLAAGKASIDKVSHYAWRTVCAIAGFVAVLNRFEELGILTFMRTYWPDEPVVKATARYSEQTTHRSRWPDGSIFGDEAVLHLRSAAK
jgi:hypothetical protein